MTSIGIDIGKKSCAVCIMADNGKVLENTSYLNKRTEIVKFTKRIKRYKKIKAVCESTANMWIKTYNVFEDAGISIVLANPYQIKAIASARVKTDKVDARMLATLLRADLIPACHVPPMNIRNQKSVLRGRIGRVENRTRDANKLNNLLDKYDVEAKGTHLTGVKNLKHIETDDLGDEYDNYLKQQHVDHIRYLTDQIKGDEEMIRSIVKDNYDAKIIMSMTGYDMFGAALLALSIDGIERFPTSKKFIAWLGMCPTVHQSGNTTYHGRMRKDVNGKVKWMMIQAAFVAVIHDERMKTVYENARKRHPPQVAITHVAHKMGTIIYHMLKNNTTYNEQNPQLYQRKLKKVMAG